MAIYDLLDRSTPGVRPTVFVLGLVSAAGAYLVAWSCQPEGMAVAPWMLLVTAGLVACACGGVVERGTTVGTSTGVLAAATGTLGACLAILVMVMTLGPRLSVHELGAAAEAMPLHIRATAHEGLADAPEVFGPYLVAGAVVALAGAGFGSSGMLFVVLLHALAWAVLFGEHGRVSGGVPAGIMPTLKAMGVAATYLGPAFLGLLCVGCAARTGMKRFLGGRSTDGDSSLRGPGLGLLLGLLALLLAGAVELFGGGALARMLEGG